MSFLLSLPEELIAAIADFLTVDSILPFGLACTETYRHVDKRLEKNRLYSTQYRLQHDRRPLTVINLLRLVLDNSDAAWHIKSFEDWGQRRGWKEWRSWETNVYPPNDEHDGFHEWCYPKEDYSSLDATFFGAEELQRYRMIMADVLGLNHLEVDEWMEGIRAGNEQPLKFMLFAMAPRLRRLNLIERNDIQGVLEPFRRCMPGLQNSLPGKIRSLPGLSSLRIVSVGTDRSLIVPGNQDSWPVSKCLPLFSLPNIRVLNLMSVYDDHDDENHDFVLLEGSSSVEELTLKFYYDQFRSDTWRQLIAAPKRLTLFRCQQPNAGEDDGIEVLNLLAAKHSGSLETLTMDIFDRPSLDLRPFTNLKTITRLPHNKIPVQTPPQPTTTLVARTNNGQTFLPSSLERIHIEPLDWTNQKNRENFERPWQNLLHRIVNFVEDPDFPGLSEVCLCDLPRAIHRGAKKQLVKCWKPDSEVARRLADRGIVTHLEFWDNQTGRVDRKAHQRLHDIGQIHNESDPRSVRWNGSVEEEEMYGPRHWEYRKIA